MGALTKLVEGYFEKNKWEYDIDSEEGLYLAGADTENGEFDIVIQADDSLNHISCYCIHPEAVPEERRAAVSEYMLRVNCGNILAIYDMDYDVGMVRMRSSLNLGDMKPTTEAIEMLIDGAISTADIYYAGLIAVIDDELSPEEAIEECVATLGERLMDEDEDGDEGEDESE